MDETMLKIEDICVELDKALKENNIQLHIMDLIRLLFLDNAATKDDDIYFGILCVIFLVLLERNYIPTDLKEDIKNLKDNNVLDELLFLKWKKCKFRCALGEAYNKIIDEDYLFFLNLLDKIQPKINIDKTIKFIKEPK